ncbi:type I-A CRISPR-associated protein Cas4/Csa1 [Candidatus Bathyarchaeota archaeon]|nr:type I-A CRISPR-associated protein Cas4/Csa1 [Candidatus Bathyarchaeota archaeon]
MPCEVSEEVRGWNWSTYPLASPSQLKLSVSDIFNNLCESWRLLYLRYTRQERPYEIDVPVPLLEGSFIHSIFTEATKHAKGLLYHEGLLDAEKFRQGFDDFSRIKFHELLGNFKGIAHERAERIFDRIWGLAAYTYAACLDRFSLRSRYLVPDGLISSVVPLTTESPIDGSLVGLSKSIRPDAILWPTILVELKTRQQHPSDALALTAYAIAFESQYEIPQNFGVILYLRLNQDGGDFKVYERLVQFSDKLRTEFIEKRDRALTILEQGIDPGLPPECSLHCPYIRFCKHDR